MIDTQDIRVRLLTGATSPTTEALVLCDEVDRLRGRLQTLINLADEWSKAGPETLAHRSNAFWNYVNQQRRNP